MSTEADPSAAVLRGEDCRIRAREYDWDEVANGYEKLCVRLANGELTRPGLGGRRRGPGWEPGRRFAT